MKTKLFRKSWIVIPVLLVAALFVSVAFATSWPSTNELNRTGNNPARGAKVGASHYVELVEVNGCEVTLNFVNTQNYGAWFEYRIDEKEVVGSPHPVVDANGDWNPGGGARDVIYPTVAVENDSVQQTFFARDEVEVRLALGAERDWDFDWVTFQSEGCNYTPPKVCGEIGPDGNNLAELARNVFGNEVLFHDLIAKYDLEEPYIVHPGEEYCLPQGTQPGDFLTGPEDPNILPYGFAGLVGLLAVIGGGILFLNPRRFRSEH